MLRYLLTLFDTTDTTFSDLTLENSSAGKLTKVSSLSDLFVLLINTIYIFGIALGLLFVIIGGIKIVTSAGDTQKLSEGRSTVTWAVAGVILVIGFKIIVNIVLDIFGLQKI